MVESTIGPDRKPVLRDRKNCISSKESFNQWFRETDNVNKVFPYSVWATWDPSKKAYVYYNNNFFPIDNQGWGNQWQSHNYGFCLEIHNQFTYQGGETYWFQGDDDVWVFINDKLVIDLGGVHGPADGSVNLDTLGLTVGENYYFDFFFCERHTSGSNMAFTTNVKLDPCGTADSDSDGIPDKCDNCPFGNIRMKIGEPVISGKTASVPITVGTTIRNAVEVKVDWGDGNTESKWIAIDSSFVHTYAKEGTYTVTVGYDAQGCGSDEISRDEVKIGSRIAPSCANRLTPSK